MRFLTFIEEINCLSTCYFGGNELANKTITLSVFKKPRNNTITLSGFTSIVRGIHPELKYNATEMCLKKQNPKKSPKDAPSFFFPKDNRQDKDQCFSTLLESYHSQSRTEHHLPP
ncbi:hypothetical protein CDAR_383431 [Caerostris darwini]|uniref:LAGLIDADG homing endonuclease n=1 Tax=Caerostris darwini TaxID=1538125 RepID=A0AAV4NVH7_9ARAC|nr:hypothetical protein CDAR_383431 [Caerostris darwini]